MVRVPLRGVMTSLVALLFLLSPISPATAEENGPQPYFGEAFDELDGWTFTGSATDHWQLSDRRAREGTSLYFGDNGSFPDCPDPCRATAKSPAFTLDGDGPAFLYFWAFLGIDDFWDDGLRIYATGDSGDGLTWMADLGPVPNVYDRFVKLDLSGLPAGAVSLHFEIYQSWAWPYNEGAYLDHIVVTDVDIEVSHSVRAEGEGVATELLFTVPEGGADATVRIGREGRVDGTSAAGSFSALYIDGDLWFGSSFWFTTMSLTIDINLLGEDVIREEILEPNTQGTMGSTLTMNLHGAPAGEYRVVSYSAGLTEIDSYLDVDTASGLDGVQYGLGGESLGFAWARDLDIDGAFVGANHQTALMSDGHKTIEAPGRAAGSFWISADHADVQATTPDGPSGQGHPFHMSESGGTWSFDVDLVINARPIPWIVLVGLAELSDAVDLPAVDLGGLPDPGETDPVEPPEPEPWPDGYNVSHGTGGLIGCAVSQAPLQTKDLCLDGSQAQSNIELPAHPGLTALTVDLTTEAGPLGEAVLCAYLTRPAGVTLPACSDTGEVTVWTADPGEVWNSENQTLRFDIRVMENGGVAFMQPFSIIVDAEYWGGTDLD